MKERNILDGVQLCCSCSLKNFFEFDDKKPQHPFLWKYKDCNQRPAVKVIYLSKDGGLNRAGREASLCNSFIINVKKTHFIYHF